MLDAIPKGFLYGATIASIVLALASLILVPFIIIRLPADYFESMDRKGPLARIFDSDGSNRAMRMAYKIIKNIVAGLLILAGLAMLVLPGQGLLVVVFGLILADIPGKQRLVRWLVCRDKVLKFLNWIRRKAHKDPFTITACDKQDENSPIHRAA
jgi:Na+/proline symporter